MVTVVDIRGVGKSTVQIRIVIDKVPIPIDVSVWEETETYTAEDGRHIEETTLMTSFFTSDYLNLLQEAVITKAAQFAYLSNKIIEEM